jgi:galactosyl transferase GMA12/MNN10 family
MYAIATMHDATYQALADITFNQNKVPYCDRWGYKLYAKTDGFSEGKHIYFDKMRHILEVMHDADLEWIWWLDGDAMITNWTIPLETYCDPEYHFVISVDRYNLNNGSFFIRNSQQGRNYIEHILSLESQYLDHIWPDQQPMIDLIEQYQTITKIHSQRDFNSYDYDFYHRDHGNTHDWDLFGNNGNWQPGDFVMHYPGVTMQNKIVLAGQLMDKIVK